MPRQPSTLFESHTQQQPFTLVHEHEAWHVTFSGYRCELDVKGSRIEAQAIARCYHSLFLAPGAPFAHAESGSRGLLPAPSPLRTVQASFPAQGVFHLS